MPLSRNGGAKVGHFSLLRKHCLDYLQNKKALNTQNRVNPSEML